MAPWVTTMDAQGAKMEPTGPQNYRFGYKNGLSSRHPIKSCLLSRSAVVQLLVDKTGRRQGARPLNISNKKHGSLQAGRDWGLKGSAAPSQEKNRKTVTNPA